MAMHIKRNRLLCQVAIAFFILAGITGVLFRMGMLGADIFGLSLQNIRHAHSHLMFFGWAGFLPLIIASNAQSHAASKKWTVLQQRAIWAIVVLSPITFFFFLLWGYHPVAIGEAQLPLAAILSSFVMIAWYAFAFGYWRSKPEKSKPFQSWFSVALLMLIVSSLGAWGVGALQFFDIENILIPKAMTHFFLGTFTEGWVVLIVMGLIVRALKLQSSDFFLSQSTLQTMIAFGAPITFAFGMPNSMLTNELLWSARIGGMISSAAILIFCFGALKSVWRTNSIWLWPVVLLGTKALIVLITSLFPNELWLSDHNLRILYLHILLLGAFTIAGFGWMHSHFNTTRQSFNLIVYSCLAVLISLVLPTNVVPTPMKGLWVFYVITLVAIFPVISAMYQFVMVKLSS